jgi:beta-lactamase class A
MAAGARKASSARALTPQHAIRTTAREMATLLRLIWRDEASPAQACAQVRQLMARPVTCDPQL